MSEAITADIPLKPPVIGLKPVPLKPEPPPKPDLPLVEPTAGAADPPPVPDPPGALTKLFALFGLTLTRRQAGVTAGAIASLLLGIVGVKMLVPTKTPPATQSLAEAPPAPKPAPPTTPVDSGAGSTTPPTGTGSPTGSKPTGPTPGSIPIPPDGGASSTPPGSTASRWPGEKSVAPPIPNGIDPRSPTGTLSPPTASVERGASHEMPLGSAPLSPGLTPPVAPSGVEPPKPCYPGGGGTSSIAPPVDPSKPFGGSGGAPPVTPPEAFRPAGETGGPTLPPLPAPTGVEGGFGGAPGVGPPSAVPPPGNVVPAGGVVPPSTLPVPSGALPGSGTGSGTGTGVPPLPPLGPVTPPSGGLPPGGGIGAAPTPVPPVGGLAPPAAVTPPLPSGSSAGGASLPPIGPLGSPLSPEPPAVTPPTGLPPLPSVTPPTTPAPTPSGPVTPPAGITPPTGLVPPLVDPQPRALPMSVDPTPTSKVEFSKGGGTDEAKPLAVSPPVNHSAPKTTFDLDLHAIKATDTYDSICREYYNDAKYSIALKEFNRGRALASGGMLEVPPIHVLKKQFPASISTPSRATPGVTPEWGAASPPPATTTGTRPTEFRASKSGTYTVPAGGATIKQIAKLTLGSDQKWADIWNMNPQLTRADDVLAAGTVVKLPSDARVPE